MIAPVSMLVGPGSSKAVTVILVLAGLFAVSHAIQSQKAATTAAV